jgi:intraflagellar transport protein 88
MASTSQYDFNKAAKKPPPTGQVGFSRAGRLGTGAENRPITSNKGAGFGRTNNFGSTADRFASKQKKEEKPMDPEMKIRRYEQEINQLIDESAILTEEGNLTQALQKAKEAVQKQKHMERYLDQNEFTDMMNMELYFCVNLNLATLYEKNELYQDAIQEYTSLTNAKIEFGIESFVRVNMGNIYFNQKMYQKAIKMYKKALDLVPPNLKMSMKYKIMRNLGHAYVQQSDFFEATRTYEEILDKSPDFESAFNLMLCYFTKGDKDKMKNNFLEMINIGNFGEESDDQVVEEEDQKKPNFKVDLLKDELKNRKKRAAKYILDAAKLIAPAIEEDPIEGYNWIIDLLKGSKSRYTGVQSEIEIKKAVSYINQKDIEKAIETLKAFEKKDKSMMAIASTNISFLYFLEQDYKNSDKYAEMALEYDRYNAKALVNKGNCLFIRNDFRKAKECYLEAIGVAADCVEALYNLALVNKKLNNFHDALTALDKLQTIVSKNPEVLYQIASLHDLMGNNKLARKWFDILITYCPNDPNIHARLGSLYAFDKDESQVRFFHYIFFSFMFFGLFMF